MDNNWRKEQLKEWEVSRLLEVRIDTWAHWMRSIPGLVITASIWFAIDLFNLPFPNLLKYVIAFCGATYLAGRIIVWLRLEGA
jgi:hypothetical protein